MWFCMETFIFDWWWRSRQSLAREGLRIFRFCVMPWKDERDSKVHHNTELWTQLMVRQWNSSGTFFTGFTTLQLCSKVQEFMSKMSVKPEEFTGRIIFMSMFNDISWGSKEKIQECELSAQPRFYLCEKIFIRKMVIPRTWIRKEVVFYSW